MKKIKLFEEFLLEFDYGKHLFADPETVAAGGTGFEGPDADEYARWLKSIGRKEIEADTPEEKELLKDLMNYFEHGDNMFNHQLKYLLALKKKYPNMLDPQEYFPIQDAYRGASIPMEQFIRIINNNKGWKKNYRDSYLKKLKKNSPPFQPTTYKDSLKYKTEIKKQNWVKPFVNETGNLMQLFDIKGEIYKTRGKKGFISLSTSGLDARKFMLENKIAHYAKGRMPVVIKVDYSKIAKKAVINPEFVTKLSDWDEDEFLVIGNELPISEITFPNPLASPMFDDKIDRETQLKIYKALFDYDED